MYYKHNLPDEINTCGLSVVTLVNNQLVSEVADYYDAVSVLDDDDCAADGDDYDNASNVRI